MKLSLSNEPWYTQIALFLILAIGGVVAFYFFYASSAQEEVAARERKLQALQIEIDKGHITERRLPQFKKELAELQTRFEVLKAVLPEEKDIADLLRRMQILAAQSNLVVRAMKPLPVVDKQLYLEVPHEVEFDASFHNLGTFLDRLGRLSRVIRAADISIQGKDKQMPTSTIIAKCVATTFVLADPNAPPPAPAKAQGGAK